MGLSDFCDKLWTLLLQFYLGSRFEGYQFFTSLKDRKGFQSFSWPTLCFTLVDLLFQKSRRKTSVLHRQFCFVRLLRLCKVHYTVMLGNYRKMHVRMHLRALLTKSRVCVCRVVSCVCHENFCFFVLQSTDAPICSSVTSGGTSSVCLPDGAENSAQFLAQSAQAARSRAAQAAQLPAASVALLQPPWPLHRRKLPRMQNSSFQLLG